MHAKVAEIYSKWNDEILKHKTNWDALNMDETFALLNEGAVPIEEIPDVLRKCRKERNKLHATRLLAYLRKTRLETHKVLGNLVVLMLIDGGNMRDAHDVFNRLDFTDGSSSNSLITACVSNGEPNQALALYEKLQDRFQLTGHTYVALLQACRKVKNMALGVEIHLDVSKKGIVDRNIFIGNTLVDMYAKCGSLKEAQIVFDNISVRDVVLWTALIAGYVEHGCGQEALKCFERMQEDGIAADTVTYICSLKACGSIRSTCKGQEIHAQITREGFEAELLIRNTLLDMYAKCGLIVEAQEIFETNPVRSVVSWNALITAYGEHEQGSEALQCFEQMQYEGNFPDAITFVSALRACASIGTINKGLGIHAMVNMEGSEKDCVVGSALVYMYAKCGSLLQAQIVFDKLPVHDVVSWTALIAGYAQRGESKNVFETFEKMIRNHVRPNLVTFVCVLNACNHAGIVDKGRHYFESMSREYGIMPTRKHYACFIDLLGRAGHLNEAVETIKKMPFHPGIIVWHIVLAACHKWGNVEIARIAFSHASRLDEKDASAYICMSNIYVNAGMEDAANEILAMRMEKHAWNKKPYGHTILSDWEIFGHIE